MSDNAFQVWHKEREGYVHAFTVRSKDLAGALIGPMLEPRPAAVTEHIPHARSTTMGDVIVAASHDAFEVTSSEKGISFEPVDFPPAQRAKVAAEQREDIRGAIADGLRMGAKLSQIVEEAAAYGVKPEEVLEIRRQVSREAERGTDRYAEIMSAPPASPLRETREKEPEMER